MSTWTAAVTCDRPLGLNYILNKKRSLKGDSGVSLRRRIRLETLMIKNTNCINCSYFPHETLLRLCCHFSLTQSEHIGSRPVKRKDESGRIFVPLAWVVGQNENSFLFSHLTLPNYALKTQGWKQLLIYKYMKTQCKGSSPTPWFYNQIYIANVAEVLLKWHFGVFTQI